MLRKTLTCLMIALAIPCVRVSAQQNRSATNSEWHSQKSSTTCGAGYYLLPGFLLDLQLKQHPKNLNGLDVTCDYSHSLGNNGWRWGVDAMYIKASGFGNYEPKNQTRLNQAGVQGFTQGEVRLFMPSVGFFFEKRRAQGRFEEYVRIGIGIGHYSGTFTGRFLGHETESGENFPVNEPAHDKFSGFEPVPTAQGGLRLRVVKNLHFSAAPFWANGWGGQGNLEYRF